MGRAKALIVESGNLGSSLEPFLRPSFFICEIRGLNQMLFKVSPKVSKVFDFSLLTILKGLVLTVLPVLMPSPSST